MARINDRSGIGGQPMSGNQSDSWVAQIIEAAPPETINEMVGLIQKIDNALARTDISSR